MDNVEQHENDAPHFNRFSWLWGRDDPSLDLACAAYDIANGVSLIVQTLERIEISDSAGTPPMYCQTDCGVLKRLAITSLDLLRDLADQDIERRNDKHQAAKDGKGARK